MWIFSKRETNKTLQSEEYATLLKRYLDVDTRVRRLELSEEDFRNKVLRKFQAPRVETETNINTNSRKKRFGGRNYV